MTVGVVHRGIFEVQCAAFLAARTQMLTVDLQLLVNAGGDAFLQPPPSAGRFEIVSLCACQV